MKFWIYYRNITIYETKAQLTQTLRGNKLLQQNTEMHIHDNIPLQEIRVLWKALPRLDAIFKPPVVNNQCLKLLSKTVFPSFKFPTYLITEQKGKQLTKYS